MTKYDRVIEIPEEWKPERKMLAVAVALIVAWAAQQLAGIDIPELIEGAFVVLVGYFIPNR